MKRTNSWIVSLNKHLRRPDSCLFQFESMSIEFPERFNMTDYFLYHNLEEGRENKCCLYFQDQTFTYPDVARMSNRVGNTLRDFGLHIEDRILIILPDCPEFVWTWFGAARIGAVITMVNPLLPAA